MRKRPPQVYDPAKAISYPQIAVIIGATLFVGYCGISSFSSTSNSGTAQTTALVEARSNRAEPQSQPLPNAVLSEEQAKNYRADPSSMGYGDQDREFLKEQGVSENEARAAEEVLSRNGVR